MEKPDQTIAINVRIPIELFAEMSKELSDIKLTRSEFVRDAIEEKLASDNRELMEQKIKYMEKELEVLKLKCNQIKTKRKEMEKIPVGEMEFLKETKILLEKDPTFLKGRIQLYKNRFNKQFRISQADFWDLLDKVK